jgi:hypothetical protein
MGARAQAVDNESAVNTASPPMNGKAASRLLDHCVRAAGHGEARPHPRERLEAEVGGELAQRLVGALAGNHAVPARLYAD